MNSDFLDRGYFVDSEDEWEIDEYVEPYPKYQPGLFHPVCIGEILAERYRIEHKIGHGGFYTVWTAFDLQEKKSIALKIMSSGETAENEYNIQREIIQNAPDVSNLLTHSASFLLPGYGYHHRVLVLPLLSQNLESTITNSQVLMTTRMSAAKQLLRGLASLHSAGIVHRGKFFPCFFQFLMFHRPKRQKRHLEHSLLPR
jgi:hypothetical protein